MPRLSASLDYNPTKPSRFEGALPPPPTNLYEYQNKGLMEFSFCKRLILKEMFSDGQTGHWAGKTARNPKCLSLEVSFRGLNKAVDYTRALVAGPGRFIAAFGNAMPAVTNGRSLRRNRRTTS